MRIAVDAMGSDDNPGPDVAGSVLAAQEWGDTILLVGDRAKVEAELGKHDTTGLNLEVVPASQAITMTDKPGDIVKGKPDSSMHVGMNLVKEGQADAFVSAGNTGGLLAIAMLGPLGRIRGIKRAALTAIYPLPSGLTVSADIGANADCKPENLVEFAQMSSLYAELALGVKEPRVALLSNGEEEGKGNQLVKETIPLMHEQSTLNYIGNLEPKEILSGGTDVIIHDGFAGNVLLKTLEATAKMVKDVLAEEIKAGLITSLGGALAYPAFKRVGALLDPGRVGGVPLLGIDGLVISAHGRSDEIAIKNAIRQARQAIRGDVVENIRARLGR
jgi:glycerol-3-phosphate acyltransferase PlsX